MVIKILLLVLIVGSLVVGVTRFLPQIKDKLQGQNIAPHLSGNTLVLNGEVVATPSDNQNKVLGIMTKLGGVVSGAALAGDSLLGTVTSSPANSGDVIDVGKVTNDIASRVESIPSTVLQQAKVAYCQQVLLQATSSANPNSK
ncbi:MAG TPA: hypothetical protein VLH19_03940 [Patescibacteria group bacterium]|nr:hypothetical protein [Patescibacteria group bacterium]